MGAICWEVRYGMNVMLQKRQPTNYSRSSVAMQVCKASGEMKYDVLHIPL